MAKKEYSSRIEGKLSSFSEDKKVNSTNKKEDQKIKKKQIMINLPEDILEDISVPSMLHGSRSAYIVHLMKQDLKENAEKYDAIKSIK